MPKIKCVGCRKLVRESQPVGNVNPKFPLVVYSCDRFPYWCVLSGLLKPSKGIQEAAAGCPVDIPKHCLICGKKTVLCFGNDQFAWACHVHYDAWSAWLDNHPEKAEYFSPRGRTIGARWIEVFLEWAAEAKKEKAALNINDIQPGMGIWL
jgi:hypothetical protein